MDTQILKDIAADAAFLTEEMARRGVPPSAVARITAGAMPAIAAYETSAHAARRRAGESDTMPGQ